MLTEKIKDTLCIRVYKKDSNPYSWLVCLLAHIFPGTFKITCMDFQNVLSTDDRNKYKKYQKTI